MDSVQVSVALSDAIHARHVKLSAGPTCILQNLNLSVPTSSIYCLIGPSGCGKTTFLRCVVGLNSPDSGTLKLFGHDVRTKGLGIPGPNLGYMPQDIDLNNDLTIYEMLSYFGKLFRLKGKELHEEIKDLIKLLELPEEGARLIGNLSDGQKRRVCFAATILHKPKLAILDEPTVGVDPILREVIWKYLVQLVSKKGMTIVVTTHYIEEARRANLIGFMRKGEVIEEGSPGALMKSYAVNSLEKTFALLCLQVKKKSTAKVKEIESEEELQKLELPSLEPENLDFKSVIKEHWLTFWIVFSRIFLRVYKKKVFLVLFFVFEIFEYLIFISCFGRTPFNLPVGIVNQDMDYSQDFLSVINKDLLILKNFTDLREAQEASKRKEIHGYIHFPPNYTDTLFPRLFLEEDLSDSEIGQSTIWYHGDLTNRILSDAIENSLGHSFHQFVKNLLAESENDTVYNPPIRVEETIYGEQNTEDIFGIKQVIGPQMLVYFRFVHAIQISIFSLLHEKNEKIFDRTFAAGVKANHILFAHFFVNFFLSGITSLPFLWTSVTFFDIPCFGSFTLAYQLTLLQIIAGVLTGMFYSSLTDNLTLVTILSVGLQFLSLFLGGSMWLTQALPYYIAPLRYFVSYSVPNESLLAVMLKGLSFSNWIVQKGFIYSFLYIIIIATAVKLKFKF